jgi:hypothetical protein
LISKEEFRRKRENIDNITRENLRQKFLMEE